jgi:AcrR family transcriptional regulator
VKRRTRLEPDLRRKEILAAATVLFREHGYAGVSLEDVAGRAGVTRGLLHHYFGSKRALFLEVLERQVHIPAGMPIVPRDVSGDFASVIKACVQMWMTMIEGSGGLLAGIPGTGSTGGIAGTDVDAVLENAREDLVTRMLAEVPFPADLDRDLLRSALRCYAAFARVASDEWLVHHTLDREQTEVLFERTLLALVDAVVPAMSPSPVADAD